MTSSTEQRLGEASVISEIPRERAPRYICPIAQQNIPTVDSLVKYPRFHIVPTAVAGPSDLKPRRSDPVG
jgi:hypothetical protein